MLLTKEQIALVIPVVLDKSPNHMVVILRSLCYLIISYLLPFRFKGVEIR